jgi:hypothetical protein
MSVFEMTTNPRDPAAAGELLSSPFASADLTATAEAGPASASAVASALTTPFSEALALLAESDLEAEAFAALTAEFEDEEFTEALEALVSEAAARHLASTGSWSHESGAMQLAHTEVEQWLATVAAEADRRLAELEAHFGDRPVDSVSESEIDAFGSGAERAALDSPVNAQEQFFKKLLDKAKKVVKGAVKLAKKGIKAAGKLLPTGRIFAALRKLVGPLLKRVLAKAIGKLPAPLRPAARRLAGKLSGAASGAVNAAAGAVGAATGAAGGTGGDAAAADGSEALSASFDEALAEAVLAPNEAALAEALEAFEAEAAAVATSESSVEALDLARHRLARQLAEAQPGQPPTAEMEEFIPAVMAAMPLIKLGVTVIGRDRVVKFVAGLLANLIKPMIGPEIAAPLSRQIADAGLGLLGLEAEAARDGTLGAEALVAAT